MARSPRNQRWPASCSRVRLPATSVENGNRSVDLGQNGDDVQCEEKRHADTIRDRIVEDDRGEGKSRHCDETQREAGNALERISIEGSGPRAVHQGQRHSGEHPAREEGDDRHTFGFRISTATEAWFQSSKRPI